MSFLRRFRHRLGTLALMLEAIGYLPWATLHRRRHFVANELQGTAGTAPELTSNQIERAGRVARALFLCQAYCPVRLNCLSLALAGQRMLRRRGIPSRIQIGVRESPDDARLLSHAWLYVGGRVVTGGLPDASFRPIWTQPDR